MDGRLSFNIDGRLSLKMDGRLSRKIDGRLSLKMDGKKSLNMDGRLSLNMDGSYRWTWMAGYRLIWMTGYRQKWMAGYRWKCLLTTRYTLTRFMYPCTHVPFKRFKESAGKKCHDHLLINNTYLKLFTMLLGVSLPIMRLRLHNRQGFSLGGSDKLIKLIHLVSF